MFYRADMTAALAPQQNALWGFEPLTANPVTSPWRQLDPDSSVLHQPNWLQGADGAFQELEADVEWRSTQRPMYDRIVEVPRLISTLAPRSPATPSTVRRIVEHAEQLLGVQVEHVGLNLYRSGQDSVTWHRDKIGQERDWSVIALVSLGGPRTLQMRPWKPAGRSGRRHTFHLASGDLLVMAGACQRDWEHAVLKTARASPRISIALRSKQFPQGPLFQHAGVTTLTPRRELQLCRGRSGGLQ